MYIKTTTSSLSVRKSLPRIPIQLCTHQRSKFIRPRVWWPGEPRIRIIAHRGNETRSCIYFAKPDKRLHPGIVFNNLLDVMRVASEALEIKTHHFVLNQLKVFFFGLGNKNGGKLQENMFWTRRERTIAFPLSSNTFHYRNVLHHTAFHIRIRRSLAALLSHLSQVNIFFCF